MMGEFSWDPKKDECGSPSNQSSLAWLMKTADFFFKFSSRTSALGIRIPKKQTWSANQNICNTEIRLQPLWGIRIVRYLVVQKAHAAKEVENHNGNLIVKVWNICIALHSAPRFLFATLYAHSLQVPIYYFLIINTCRIKKGSRDRSLVLPASR